MNRHEFMKFAEEELKNLSGNVLGALLYTEKAQNFQCEYFLVSKKVLSGDSHWDWCKANLSAMPICYYLNAEADEEWWGFTNQKDAFIWMTRWA